MHKTMNFPEFEFQFDKPLPVEKQKGVNFGKHVNY